MEKPQTKTISLKPYTKKEMVVAEEYEYLWFHKNQIKKVNIPKGFISDGASIPRIFWIFYPPYKPEYLTPCVVHDFLCKEAFRHYRKYGACSRIYNPEFNLLDSLNEVNLMFETVLLSHGVSRFTALVFSRFCLLRHRAKVYYFILKKAFANTRRRVGLFLKKD